MSQALVKQAVSLVPQLHSSRPHNTPIPCALLQAKESPRFQLRIDPAMTTFGIMATKKSACGPTRSTVHVRVDLHVIWKPHNLTKGDTANAMKTKLFTNNPQRRLMWKPDNQ